MNNRCKLCLKPIFNDLEYCDHCAKIMSDIRKGNAEDCFKDVKNHPNRREINKKYKNKKYRSNY